jgi:hypothetical protein
MEEQMKAIWKTGEADKRIAEIRNGTLDIILQYNNLVQWLVMVAAKNNKALTIINIGAGIKRVMSSIDNCPTCGKKL